MRRLVGNARVSTGEQDFQSQLDALRPVGCSDANIYTDKPSGVRGNRPDSMPASRLFATAIEGITEITNPWGCSARRIK